MLESKNPRALTHTMLSIDVTWSMQSDIDARCYKVRILSEAYLTRTFNSNPIMVRYGRDEGVLVLTTYCS